MRRVIKSIISEYYFRALEWEKERIRDEKKVSLSCRRAHCDDIYVLKDSWGQLEHQKNLHLCTCLISVSVNKEEREWDDHEVSREWTKRKHESILETHTARSSRLKRRPRYCWSCLLLFTEAEKERHWEGRDSDQASKLGTRIAICTEERRLTPLFDQIQSRMGYVLEFEISI